MASATLFHPAVGSLSQTTKMPGFSFGISAKKCITGAKLRKIKGTVCHTCYAFRAFYQYPSVTNAHENRLNLFNADNEAWTAGMIYLIKKSATKYFRFFDSGDLQSLDMLKCIVNVVRACKGVKFWLPTREYGIIGDYNREGLKFPSNLNVRLSAYMVNADAPVELAASMGCTASGVTSGKGNCYAQTSGSKECGTCRKCWSPRIPSVNYHSH